MTPAAATAGEALLLHEYREANAHLRANMTQFVNWFSFFLASSFVAAAVFLVATRFWPELRGSTLAWGVEVVFLLLHLLAFAGIVTFRAYIIAAHCRIEEVARRAGEECASPVPVRFSKWMTNLMAAGYVISYFAWFSLLFLR